MRFYKKLTAMLASVVLASGCATVETESWQNCAMGGALLGGAGGAFVEGATEVAVGAAAGGTLGGLLCETEPEEAPGVEPDTDKDGVVGSRDACPNTPVGAIVDSKGCTLDTDSDGVADYKDQCPSSALGAIVNELGCAKALVLEGVNFYTASAELTESAKTVLLPIATAHSKHYGDVNLLITGHTDSQGSDVYNQSLSEKRAASVRAFMIMHGSDANRLSTEGYGERKPIADNGTKEGRAKNRRVEITVKK